MQEKTKPPIGQRLRSEREDKGASRVDVSQETKIAVHHLAALEYSDFKELPDMVHVKGYVRAYAEYLGLEPTAVLEEFLEEYEAQRPTEGEDPRDDVVRKMSRMYGGSQGSWIRRMRPVLIAGALALIAVLVWVGWGRLGSQGDAGDSGLEERASAGSTTTAQVVETPAEEQEADPQQFVVIRDPEQGPERVPEQEAAETAEPPTPSSPAPAAPSPELATPTPRPAAAAAETTTSTPEPTPAPPRPEPTPAPPVASGTRLGIQQFGVGTGVESRQLRGESDRFGIGTKVAFFTRVEGGRTGDRIRHVWRHEGNQIASIPLQIGSANWRTYSLKTMHAGSAGAWTVEALDESGNVLARSEFNCLP